MIVNFNLEGLEEKDVREIKYLLQTINDTLEGGIWHTNIKEGAITGVLSDSLYNTKIGTEALHSITTGHSNVAMGYQALYSNALGYHNTAIGYKALNSNTHGIGNTAIGYQALYSHNHYNYTTAVGYKALYFNTTGGWNTALGYEVLYSNTIGDDNIAIGRQALYSNTEGSYNTAIGNQALYSNVDGIKNTAIGYKALYFNTEGQYNTAFGELALFNNTTGEQNTAISYNALISNLTGNYNTAIGYKSLEGNTEGLYNTAVGFKTLYSNVEGDYNVTLGNKAGYYETGSNKLYIDNSDTATPLIYGEFDNNVLTVYGNLGIGTKTFGTSATKTLAMLNGTIPSTSPANAIQLYAEDVSASSELKVRDEATNVSTLSPHNFELFKPNVNDPFPWSYHSINKLIGKKVNADISGALRELENLTGKKFLYYEDVDKLSLSEYLEDKKEQLIANYIAENKTQIEVEKNEAWGEVEVEIQDMKIITGYDTKYEFDDKTGEVKEIKKPKYGKKKVLKNKLKNEYRFNEKTGKFLKTIKSTEKEAEKEIKKELIIPDWIEDRL